MAYKGSCYRIPIGTRGLMTDDTQGRMHVDALLEARNISFYKNLAEKEPGSLRWNESALPAPIIALNDFWPDDVSQRVCALASNGIWYKFIDKFQAVALGAASSSDPLTVTLASSQLPCFVQGGAENGGARKLFLFTGSSQVQVLEGDASTRRSITKPASDWTAGNMPTAGCIHAGRLAAWGNRNYPHMLYLSSATDHEDFQTNGAVLFFPIFPGEGERILGCYNFKGRLFIFKYPRGVYYLDDSDPSVGNWKVFKLSGAFGAASAFSFVEALDDLFVANSQGSVTQMSATLNFGSITSGNLLRNLRNEQWVRQQIAHYGYLRRQGIWYEEKKTAYWSYQSAGGTRNDRLLVVDFNDPQTPKLSWSDKDQPSCLALIRDSSTIQRPAYGADDGFIYRMDFPTWDVAGQAYEGSFKTINHDFGSAGASASTPIDHSLAEREKLYDFLEVTFEEAGAWNLSIDVYIDNFYSETLQVPMTKKQRLGSFPLGPTGSNQALGRSPQSYRVPLHGKGRRIAFKCYNRGLREHFRVSELGVYFRLAGQAQEA